MKAKTARRVLARNEWKIARSMVENGKIKPPSLAKRVKQATKIEEKCKKMQGG